MQAQSSGETIRFRIPGDPKYVATIRRAVQSIAHSLGFPDDLSLDIEISVAEALANAVEHGSPERNGNTVVVVCKIEEDKLTIDVRDEGSGFDEKEIEDVSEPFSEHGRGLRMIYGLMDKVIICRTHRGGRIRMVKKKRNIERTKRIA